MTTGAVAFAPQEVRTTKFLLPDFVERELSAYNTTTEPRTGSYSLP